MKQNRRVMRMGRAKEARGTGGEGKRQKLVLVGQSKARKLRAELPWATMRLRRSARREGKEGAGGKEGRHETNECIAGSHALLRGWEGD